MSDRSLLLPRPAVAEVTALLEAAGTGPGSAHDAWVSWLDTVDRPPVWTHLAAVAGPVAGTVATGAAVDQSAAWVADQLAELGVDVRDETLAYVACAALAVVWLASVKCVENGRFTDDDIVPVVSLCRTVGRSIGLYVPAAFPDDGGAG